MPMFLQKETGRCIVWLLLLSILICCSSAWELPHGVPFTHSSFYQVGEAFRCFDNSKTLAWFKVNDDYCDCRDGSDEPGTSACENGVFFCRDIQYKSVSLRSSRVNDGVCDCCDGSDEYAGLVKCESKCGALAAAVKEARSIKRGEVEQGHQIFKEYVAQLKVRQEEERIAEEKAAQEREHQEQLQQEQQQQQEAQTTPAEPVSSVSPDAEQYGVTEAPSEDRAPENPSEHEDFTEGDEYLPSDDGHSTDEDESPTPHEVFRPKERTPPSPPPKPIDYGPEQGFHMLVDGDRCIDHKMRQYTYQFCAFDQVYQREGDSSGKGVSLGKWSSWAYAEDDMKKENPYAVMLFDQGQHCPDGTPRSTKVYVHCSNETRLSSADEPSRCEYEMHLLTPAACFDNPETIMKRLHPDE